MIVRLVTFINRRPSARKGMWRFWYQYLAKRYRTRDWTFMNYGFAPPEGAEPLRLDPADEPDRTWIELYNHVAGAVDLAGGDVLEVGSGRGGGASFLKRYLGPASVVGVDLSENAVALSAARHPVPGLSFRAGDAEQLPFEDARFDAVVNVESSHCYASMPAFVAEVARVLRPGGSFLYADFRPRDAVDEWLSGLGGSGLALVRHTDVTARVLAALTDDNERRMALIERLVPRLLMPVFRQFAGVPGSAIYDELRSGGMVYFSFVFRKPR